MSKRDDVLKILDLLMDAKWDDSNVHEAPPQVRQLGGEMGGLRRGQFLFAAGALKDVFLFAAWWPWQDGQTISLRVGPYSADMSSSEEDNLMTSFKDCFGL
jgi:hypothetical protein